MHKYKLSNKQTNGNAVENSNRQPFYATLTLTHIPMCRGGTKQTQAYNTWCSAIRLADDKNPILQFSWQNEWGLSFLPAKFIVCVLILYAAWSQMVFYCVYDCMLLFWYFIAVVLLVSYSKIQCYSHPNVAQPVSSILMCCSLFELNKNVSVFSHTWNIHSWLLPDSRPYTHIHTL